VAYGSRTGSGDGPGGAAVMPLSEALGGADVVVLAVPGDAVAEIVAANSAALAGKVVVDASNRMTDPEVNSRAAIAAAAPLARYVRAFNTLGWENFADPPQGAALFFAADPSARPVAQELISAVGLQPGAQPVRRLLSLTGFQQHERRLGIQPVLQGQQRDGVIRARQADPVHAQSMP
jgi:predicted dinucleotide-binding enzyme